MKPEENPVNAGGVWRLAAWCSGSFRRDESEK